MSSYNKVLLMGNLTRDPEVRVTSAGLSICKFSIAVSRKYKDKEETAFIDIDSFGNTADVIAKYFTKGKPIFVEGRLKFDQWEDKTSGQKRSKLGVVLDTFQFVGNRESGSANTPDSVSPPIRDTSPAAGDIDEDVPF